MSRGNESLEGRTRNTLNIYEGYEILKSSLYEIQENRVKLKMSIEPCTTCQIEEKQSFSSSAFGWWENSALKTRKGLCGIPNASTQARASRAPSFLLTNSPLSVVVGANFFWERKVSQNYRFLGQLTPRFYVVSVERAARQRNR